MFFSYCSANQTILELHVVHMIVIFFIVATIPDLIKLHYSLEQIRQCDMFCNFFGTFYIYHDHLLDPKQKPSL